MLNVIALAVLPALILLFYTYQQDKMQREPVKMIGKGFLWGCLSVFCSFFISVPSMNLGVFPTEIHSFWDAFRTAFFGAAIPEETAKLFCLWMFLRKNPYFDERMDGIVYAVCIGMGFAAFENIEYLFAAGTDWVTTGIGRSLTAIPGHFGFAVIMGYYFSLNHFDRYRSPGAAWGTISEQNRQKAPYRLLDGMGSLDKPYVEAGVGIANIFRIIRVDGFWRLTHRNDRNFVVNLSMDLDF